MRQEGFKLRNLLCVSEEEKFKNFELSHSPNKINRSRDVPSHVVDKGDPIPGGGA